ncbi:hypothetical protein CKO15_11305 [Halorhodospira abdelmalekii]|nr:hypothetical protein [Halorhodospira abdelmalekii]
MHPPLEDYSIRDHALARQADLVEVRYYTAPVLGRMCDSADSPKRQRSYLQALRKMHPRQITIIEGKIIASKPVKRLADKIPECPELDRVRVHDFQEKKTDVNLAADLIAGAWTGAYEQAVVCSNDTELEAALSTVRRYHSDVRLGLIAPISGTDHRRIAADLAKHAHWSKTLSPTHLGKAQLPCRIPHSHLRRPEAW